MKKFNVAVVGATGVVGRELIKVLEEMEFPVDNLKLLASKKSIGTKIVFTDQEYCVELLTKDSFENIDLAFFSAGGKISRKYAPFAVDSGAIVIDKSSIFRMDNQVPLIVPEVNPRDVYKHKGIISSPNCSTTPLVVALKPIYDMVGIIRIIVSTYQSVSGSGKAAVKELLDQTKQVLDHKKIERTIYPHQIAFNLIPQIDDFDNNGYTNEEMKLIHETQKILADEQLKISATAIRVPVFTGHCLSVYIETQKQLSVKALKQLYLETSGIKLVDDIENYKYPMPIMCDTYDQVMVGRIRRDLANPNGLNMWLAANNLRKGAALNAVQIAQLLIN